MDNERILLVEDDPVDVAGFRRACREAGMERPVSVVNNGIEAMAYLRRAGADEVDALAKVWPRLILLDLNLPLMNGLELLKRIKADQELKRIPVVVFTTSSREADVVASFDQGVAGYVVKPLDFAEYVRAIQIIERYWELSEVGPEAPRGDGGSISGLNEA